ncbi:MAG: hypothetical protein D6718_10950 [Acidobacteria bacterium]|nr:MAG: hypothetical protein D6718_10950 [Acidobacteriota bacterium]
MSGPLAAAPGRRRTGPARIVAAAALGLAPILDPLGPSRIPALALMRDLAHIPWAAALVLLLGFGPGSGRRRAARAAAAAVSAGIAVEAIQALTAWGTPSLLDVAHDIVGAVAAALWMAGGASRLAVAAAAAAALVPVAEGAALFRSERLRHAEVPLLGRFERRAELYAWMARGRCRASLSALWSAEGRSSLKIRRAGPGPAYLVLHDPPGDWGSAESLAFEAWNPGPHTVPLRLRLTDRRGYANPATRHEETIEIPVGGSSVRLPIARLRRTPSGRDLDLGRLDALVFILPESPPASLWIDNVRLIPARR